MQANKIAGTSISVVLCNRNGPDTRINIVNMAGADLLEAGEEISKKSN